MIDGQGAIDTGNAAPADGDATPSYTEGTGVFTDHFRSSVTEMAGKETKIYDTVPDIQTLVKNHTELSSAMGGKLEDFVSQNGYFKVPGAEATDEERAAFRVAMNVPESADKYDFKLADLPEGMERDMELIDTFRDVFHTANISSEQAQPLVAAYETLQQQRQAAVQQAQDTKFNEAVTEYQKEYSTDQITTNTKQALEAVTQLMGPGDPELVETMKEIGLYENPTDLSLWRQINVSPKQVKMWTLAGTKILGGPVPKSEGDGDKGSQEAAAKELYPNSPGLH